MLQNKVAKFITLSCFPGAACGRSLEKTAESRLHFAPKMWGSGSVCGAAAPSADDRKSSRAEPRGHYFFTVYPMISRNFAEQNRSTLLSCLQLQANYSLPRVDGWPLYLPCIRIGFLSILDDEG